MERINSKKFNNKIAKPIKDGGYNIKYKEYSFKDITGYYLYGVGIEKMIQPEMMIGIMEEDIRLFLETTDNILLARYIGYKMNEYGSLWYIETKYEFLKQIIEELDNEN